MHRVCTVVNVMCKNIAAKMFATVTKVYVQRVGREAKQFFAKRILNNKPLRNTSYFNISHFITAVSDHKKFRIKALTKENSNERVCRTVLTANISPFMRTVLNNTFLC